jgi:hypothetical protein
MSEWLNFKRDKLKHSNDKYDIRRMYEPFLGKLLHDNKQVFFDFGIGAKPDIAGGN